ncbi:unnamed protein product [Camellia sinensis]
MIKVNTDAEESMKKFVLASIGKKWREWKARVKQLGYTPFANDADRLIHRPERVHEHQWRSLVYYWGTRKAQKKVQKIKNSEEEDIKSHNWQKTILSCSSRETNKKNGVPATRLEVWMAGYTNDNKPSNDKVVEVMTQMKDLGAQSNATDEEIITQVLRPERPGRVRTYGLGPSSTDVFGGGYRQSQEQTRIIQTQVQEQLNQYKAQMKMQMKEMMDAVLNQQKVQVEMHSTIQAQQERIEQLESQQAMDGPVTPAATHVHSQQQSHAYTSSFNCHRSSEEVSSHIKERKEEEEEEVDMTNSEYAREEIISGAQRVHVPEFLAFKSWLRGKALDPSKYKQHLGVIGKYRIANMTSLDSSLGPEIDLKVNVDISPDMKLEDLKLYDLIFFWLS